MVLTDIPNSRRRPRAPIIILLSSKAHFLAAACDPDNNGVDGDLGVSDWPCGVSQQRCGHHLASWHLYWLLRWRGSFCAEAPHVVFVGVVGRVVVRVELNLVNFVHQFLSRRARFIRTKLFIRA